MIFPLIYPASNQKPFKSQQSSEDIPEQDRVKFINKCNKVDRELESILASHITKLNQNQFKVLKEKKEYVNSIRNIVNDLTFTNRTQFVELYNVLKEIQQDIKRQNKDVNKLEKTIAKDTETKDELVNMLVQRMMYDTSRRTLAKPEAMNILELQKDENQQKLLEKYIIKVIRKQLKKEMGQSKESEQDMNIIVNEQLKRKLDLMENTINKLSSMESLYDKIHSKDSEQRRRIITLVEDPVKKSIKPLTQCSVKKEKVIKVKEQDEPMIKSNGTYKANTIYVSE